MENFIVTGSSSGLGLEIAKALYASGKEVVGVDINSFPEKFSHIPSCPCNVTSRDNVRDFAWGYNLRKGRGIDCIINCAGINLISPIEKIRDDDFLNVINTNVRSILLMAQYFLPGLERSRGTIVNIISNASHMPMTHSFAYNASKGAAEIATRQMARELTKSKGITVFGISPNKLRGTNMSNYIDKTFPPMRGMTYEEGRQYQLNGLITGKETDPAIIADFIVYLLSDKKRHEYLSGCILQLGL